MEGLPDTSTSAEGVMMKMDGDINKYGLVLAIGAGKRSGQMPIEEGRNCLQQQIKQGMMTTGKVFTIS